MWPETLGDRGDANCDLGFCNSGVDLLVGVTAACCSGVIASCNLLVACGL